MPESPYTRALARLRWQLFGTLTLRDGGESIRVRERRFYAWLHYVANVCKVPFRSILWCRRGELGEHGDRLHFHCLIGRLPNRRVHVGTCFQVMRLWESLGGGMARVRIFDAESEGPQYLLKSLSGGDIYESSKFGKGDELILSRSAVKMVAAGSSLRQGRYFSNRLSTAGQG